MVRRAHHAIEVRDTVLATGMQQEQIPTMGREDWDKNRKNYE